MVSTRAIVAALFATGAIAADTWTVGFYNHNCDDSVSPGKVSGSGTTECRAVSGADCMNGSLPSNFLPDGWHICGYHNSDCTGWSTSLDDSAGAGHSIIYEDGNVQSINSYRVSSGGC